MIAQLLHWFMRDVCMHLDLHAVHLKCMKEKYSCEFLSNSLNSRCDWLSEWVLLCDCKFYGEFLMRPKNAYKTNKLQPARKQTNIRTTQMIFVCLFVARFSSRGSSCNTRQCAKFFNFIKLFHQASHARNSHFHPYTTLYGIHKMRSQPNDRPPTKKIAAIAAAAATTTTVMTDKLWSSCNGNK